MEPDPQGVPVVEPASQSPQFSQPLQKPSIRVLWLVGGVVVVVLALAAGYALFRSRSPEPAQKVYHIGIFSALAYFDPAIDGFKKKMTELGYVEGQNVVYEVQKSPSPVNNGPLIQKFIDEHEDLIFVFPTEASLEAKALAANTGIPIISAAVATENSGLVDSVQNPGGNLTGVRFPVPEVAAKRLEILHEIAPDAKRIWVPYLKDYPTVPSAIEAAKSLADKIGVTLIESPFATPDEMRAYFAAHESDPGMDAILNLPEPLTIIPEFNSQMYDFAYKHKLPIAGSEVLQGDRGPIFSLIPDSEQIGELAAPLADKIFKGAVAGTIPIVTPESGLEINVKALSYLGLSAKEGLLGTADKIVH